MARRNLAGKRVLITGASSGIGRALAIELARQGAHVVLFARSEDRLHEVAHECVALGVKSCLSPGDVANQADRERAIAWGVENLGGLDLLINNAGFTSSGDFAGSTPDIMRTVFEVNFFAATELTREALPTLREGKSPMIVNMGSILGHRGIPLTCEYCASKFALTGWTQSLRAELATEGIDVLLVSPGTTNTKFHSNVVDQRVELPWAGTRGVSAEYVARKTVRAIRQGRHEIVPNWRGWWLLFANRLAPTVVDRVMAYVARQRNRA